ncbi:MAG: flavodoxin [Clostridiales bacterium]|nr:flavodoxin [Clostridiales bacterium]
MKKIAVVYWSGTGNTEQMAMAVAEGAKNAGGEVEFLTCDKFTPDMVSSYDAIGFGCPSMGAEVLEEEEFEPMFSACKPALSGKSVALFGSYGWGDGEWMRNWEDDCNSAGIRLVADSVICNEAPDETAKAKCRALGEALAG